MQKCNVFKLKEFINLTREEKTSKLNYVVRQFYEEERKILRPEQLEKECFDGIIVNPDDELIQCHCGKFYRVSHITEENSICDSCGIDMLSDNALGSELGNLFEVKQKIKDFPYREKKERSNFYGLNGAAQEIEHRI